MSNRPAPHRRAAVPAPALTAEEFALQADTLSAVPHPSKPAVRPKKDKAYSFRMTEDTLARLRKAAEREDRSIQWIFDRVLLRALDDHESKS